MAREKHTSEQNNGNCRSGVSETPISVDPAFRKVGKSSRQFSEICFSLLTVDEEIMLLVAEWMLTFHEKMLLATKLLPHRFSEVHVSV